MADPKKKNDLDETLGLGSDKKPSQESKSDSKYSLDDIDPIFKNEEKKEFSDKPIVLEEDSDVALAGGIGAATGYVAGRVLPEVNAPMPKGYDAAKTNAEVAQKSVQRQVQNVADVKSSYTSNVDAAYQELKAAQAKLDASNQTLNEVRARALKLGALPEPPPVSAPTLGSTIPVDEGAMRHNTKMGNIVDYNQVRKGITGTAAGVPEGRLSGYTQVGRLIVPQNLANAPIYNAEQLAVQKELAQAELMFKDAQKNASSMQAKWSNLSGKTPRSVQAAELNLGRASERAATAVDKAKALQEAKPSGLQRAGAAISKVPGFNILGGALTGAEAVKAYEDYNKGNYMDATMAGMGAVGGALSMVPHPVAKIGGALISIPPLMYQGYQYLTGSDKEQPAQ
jgi:hypothetical protein